MLYLIWIFKVQHLLRILIGSIFIQSNACFLKTCLILLSSNMVFVENFELDFPGLLRENFQDCSRSNITVYKSFALFSTVSCISLFHFRLLHRFWSLYTLYQGSTDSFQTQKVRQLTGPWTFRLTKTFTQTVTDTDGQWSCNHFGSQFETLKCPSIVFLKPLLFSSFIQFTKFCSKKFPFWVLWMTATRLNGITSTGFTGHPNTFRQPKSRKS